jgi:hypothetical protein
MFLLELTQNTTYNLTLNVNYTTNTFTITSPVLPNGVTITFDLVQSSMFNYYPGTLSPQPTYNNLTTGTRYWCYEFNEYNNK